MMNVLTNHPIEAAVLRVEEAKAAGKFALLFTGFYDLMTLGHGRGFEEARWQAAIRHSTGYENIYTIVGVEPNWLAEYMKGFGRPGNDQDDRVRLVRMLKPIDYSFPITWYTSPLERPAGYDGKLPYMWNQDYANMLQLLNPHDIALDAAADNHDDVHKMAVALGIGVITVEHIDSPSSSDIIEKIRTYPQIGGPY